MVDYFGPVAFTLVRAKPQVSLPMALHRKGIAGFAAVEVAITPNGTHCPVQCSGINSFLQNLFYILIKIYKSILVVYLGRTF